MNVRYITSIENVDWKEVSGIFKAVGWGERLPEQVKLSFERSSFKRFAYIGNALVGVARIVDDGYYYAWIVDLAVLPKYQRSGIGSKILGDLENDLKPFLTTMLTAAPGKSSSNKNARGSYACKRCR